MEILDIPAQFNYYDGNPLRIEFRNYLQDEEIIQIASNYFLLNEQMFIIPYRLQLINGTQYEFRDVITERLGYQPYVDSGPIGISETDTKIILYYQRTNHYAVMEYHKSTGLLINFHANFTDMANGTIYQLDFNLAFIDRAIQSTMGASDVITTRRHTSDPVVSIPVSVKPFVACLIIINVTRKMLARQNRKIIKN